MSKIKISLGMFAMSLAFLAAFAFTPPSPKTTTVLYYQGGVFTANQVKDATRWAEDNPVQSCGTGPKACSMTVDITDVTGVAGHRVLNGSRITLSASGSTTTGFIPVKTGGVGNNIVPANKS